METGKIVTIPNGIDTERIAGKIRSGPGPATGFGKMDKASDSELGFGSGPIVGIVARLDEVKGHTFLFEALSLLKAEFPTLQCLVVGDGPLRWRLEKEAKTRDLESLVRFLGFRQDMDDIYRRMDVLVLPSLTEGLPMTLLEAMAFEKPVVASSVGGIPEVVQNGRTGFLVPPKDAQMLARVLRRLILDPDLRRRMGTEGRRRVENAFSFEKEMTAYETLYGSVLARKRKTR
jgi:glycosyltransferase involved in cell wall biosynthesis